MPQSAAGLNDFAVKLANPNGSGSASANGLLMQAMFRMGVPVSGKNLFPSNIQGLPTWYEIRVSGEGYTARSLDYDLMVAMNSQTYDRDIQEVRAGGYVLYDSSWPLDPRMMRSDVGFLGVPLAKMCNEQFAEPRERVLMKNIAYAGSPGMTGRGNRDGCRAVATGSRPSGAPGAVRPNHRSNRHRTPRNAEPAGHSGEKRNPACGRRSSSACTGRPS